MVAAHCEAPALLDHAIGVQNVVARAAANIDHQSAEIFLVRRQDHLRRSKRAENHVLDVERQFFHAPDSVLNASTHAVDNMKIGLQFLPKHSDRIKDAVLPFDMVMLDDRMEKGILGRDTHLARADFYILDILFINLIAVFGEHHTAAVIKALKVRPSDCDVDASNHYVAFLLGIDYRFVDTLHRRFKIHNLAFTHATRRRLADTEDFDRAIRTAFTDDHANFRGSNLKANHQIAACHRFSLFFVARLDLLGGSASNWWALSPATERSLPAGALELPSKCGVPQRVQQC